MSRVTTVEARQIAEKLRADVQTRKRHDWAVIRWQGSIVAQYGIRRSSKPIPHPFVPGQIHVTLAQAIDLARCPLSLEGYFEILRAAGKLPSSPSSP